MNRQNDAGLTLLEVVVAITLLAALTVAVVPLLVNATKAIPPRANLVDPSALRAFSDAFMIEEGGTGSIATLRAYREMHIAWKTPDGQRDVMVRFLEGGDKRLPHDWVEFQCGDANIIRFLVRPEDSTSVADAGGPP